MQFTSNCIWEFSFYKIWKHDSANGNLWCDANNEEIIKFIMPNSRAQHIFYFSVTHMLVTKLGVLIQNWVKKLSHVMLLVILYFYLDARQMHIYSTIIQLEIGMLIKWWWTFIHTTPHSHVIHECYPPVLQHSLNMLIF
jgi:hypothetical protein